MELNDPRLTFGRFLAEAASRFGARRAIVFEGREIGYRELEREARLLARALIGAGVVKGARVAVHMGNRPEWIVAAFAVGMLGGVIVPVNTFATRAELKHVLRHSDASALLMQPGLEKHRFLEELLAEYPAIALGAPGRCAAWIFRSCGGSRASASSRRAAASRPGGSCWRTSRASPTRCSTLPSPRSSPPTTAC
jgi:non-ribosomal peptide synthetase component F